MDQALHSSKYTEWETPIEIYEQLDNEFQFNLDPCSDDHNHKCKNYFTIDDDGLSKEWYGRVFCNPPYARYVTDKWVKKAYEEIECGNAELVVLLIPSRTDTQYFHNYLYNNAKCELRFLKGRLKFLKKNKIMDSAPFPSLVAILRS